jgi:hypothetical protein
METGRWTLEGYWLDGDRIPIPVNGRTLIGWSKDDWFTMVTKLTFPDHAKEEITMAYKGRIDVDERRFTFVLQHSAFNNNRIEGEGWVGPESIVQRYWVMDDNLLRSGFQSTYKQDDRHYHLSSCIVSGSYLSSTMEALLTRYSGTAQ